MGVDMLADMADFLLLVTHGTEPADIDSVPFAHETFWTDRVGDLREEETR